MTETLIATRGLTKRYGQVQALTGVDLKIPKGAVVGLLGPNGAGKSTAIKCLLGLSRPTAGSGQIFGLDIERDSASIRRRTGYLAQTPRFDTMMTAREIVRLSLRMFYTGDRRMIEDRVQETLETVGLAGKEDRRIKGFSGGEQQRVGIAQAYVSQPELLILDEPASALDPIGRADVLKIIAGLRGRSTVFFSTHILDDVQRTSDYLVILKDGTLAAQGPIHAILNGHDGLTYSIVLRHAGDALAGALKGLPFVKQVNVRRADDLTTFHVQVSDPRAAETDLPRIALADGAALVEFGQQRIELEDAFINLVREEQTS
ncbi:MAG TPA: ABC transporter ATP-binding protein [Aggregatilineales bacterium]|jgi:ABC-2 type transport system ATP-binding protein|nr:ABC transporter ATP-binding protein [Aggregatilineales bacterium]